MLTITAVGVVAVTAIAVWLSDASREPAVSDVGVSPAALMDTLESEDFPRIEHPWQFHFPDDHGPHNKYRTELWRLAGVIEDDQRQRMGMQFMVVRIGLGISTGNSASNWAATDIYAAQFAISDPDSGSLRTYERVSRGALGLAGARRSPMRVWVENWDLERVRDNGPGLELHVATGELKLDLTLTGDHPLVDANDVAAPSAEQRAPFVFYVQPRLRVNGELAAGKRQTIVTGRLSLEHAWGELPLPGGPVARDRFILYLDDGRELFCVRTHRVDGSGEPSSTALLVGRDGRPSTLSSDDIRLVPTEHWVSDRTGVRYPVRWTLRIPGFGLALELVAESESQEGFGWTSFWAGVVRVESEDGSVGNGFVQLNGYGKT